jgi:hypothetical protein
VEKFQLVAEHGAPILIRRDFVPNGCKGVDILPPSIAPPAAIEAHFAKEQRKGLSVILPLQLVQERCAAEGLPLCGSNAFIGGKVNSDLGRLVSDYKNTPGGGPNHSSKRNFLADYWAPILLPSTADICQTLENAHIAFPNEEIHGMRMDIDGAYRRIRLRVEQITLMALVFTLIIAGIPTPSNGPITFGRAVREPG